MVSKKDHLTKQGQLKIISYYASINRGVSPKVSEFCPGILGPMAIGLRTGPHFDLYPLQNIKQKDYLDFKEGLFIINSGLHLNRDGLAKFEAIKEGMNSFRSN
jgi:hypothetical protein